MTINEYVERMEEIKKDLIFIIEEIVRQVETCKDDSWEDDVKFDVTCEIRNNLMDNIFDLKRIEDDCDW